MAMVGTYLYGFTERGFQPPPNLCGLGGAPVRTVAFGDVAAVVSPHPMQRLMPLRSNVEPHHRIVRQVSAAATLVPAAFGHITETDEEILGVIRGNYADIRHELERLDGKCEISLKLRWVVENIFEYLVRTNRDLRQARDRVFRGGEPSLNDKLQLGGLFEATLNSERERLSAMLLDKLRPVTREVATTPPRDEKTVCQAALLVERSSGPEFTACLKQAAALFDVNYTLEYSGPWPAYSFVRLRLQPAADPTAA